MKTKVQMFLLVCVLGLFMLLGCAWGLLKVLAVLKYLLS